tara:strand:- start:350 stop:520 length:171 start_codon:yes stop_codon:yes gene_type:complete
MNHYQSCPVRKDSFEVKNLNESSHGIIKRLLFKYRPSKGLRNIHGGQEENKKKIAA